jgi:hypothetical protein
MACFPSSPHPTTTILSLSPFSDELKGVALTKKIKRMINYQGIIIIYTDKEEERCGGGGWGGRQRGGKILSINTLRATFSN